MAIDISGAFSVNNPNLDDFVDSMVRLAIETDEMISEVFEEGLIDEIFLAWQGKESSGYPAAVLMSDLEEQRDFIFNTVLPDTLRAMDLDRVGKVVHKLSSKLIEARKVSNEDYDLNALRVENSELDLFIVVQDIYGEKLEEHIKQKRAALKP